MKQFSVRLGDALIEALRTRAEQTGQSHAEIIRAALVAYLLPERVRR